MTSLLEKAQSVKGKHSKKHITEEHIELALAYIKGEVSLTAVAYATLGRIKGMNAYAIIARSLTEAYARGYLTIKK